MRYLEIRGAEHQGGANQATNLITAEHWKREDYRCHSTFPQKYLRNICGYCDPLLVRQLRLLARRVDIVSLYRFSDAGTAAIKAAKQEKKWVVWHPFDYNCICPRDNCYNPNGTCNFDCLHCYKPEYPVPLKWPMIGRRKRILRWINQVDEIHTLSNHSQQFLRWHGVTAPIEVRPLRVSVPQFNVEKIPGRVLFAGWQAGNKGFHIVQKLMQLLPQVDWRVLGMTTKQALTHDEVLHEIAQASYVLIPELWPNPGPIILQEAQAIGTPCIASAIGAITEMASKNDLLVKDFNNPEAFAQTIRRALCISP